ncbi:hypothetical protein GCM10027456_27780 [Kineosporia babensis]
MGWKVRTAPSTSNLVTDMPDSLRRQVGEPIRVKRGGRAHSCAERSDRDPDMP